MEQLRRYALIAAACAGAAFLMPAAQPAGDGAVEVQLLGNFGAFQVVNHGAAIQLGSLVKVEAKVHGEWKDSLVANLYLIPKCASGAAPKCLSLAAGQTLQPVPWRGNYCYSQCPEPCDLDGPVPPGSYRFVVSTCDRKRQFVSAPFEKK
jgi:hypothetical protein